MMAFHGGGWSAWIRYDEEQDRPEVSRALLRRVATYARPYRSKAALMIGVIILTSLFNLVPPLLYRDLLDHALPNRVPYWSAWSGWRSVISVPASARGSSAICDARSTPTCRG